MNLLETFKNWILGIITFIVLLSISQLVYFKVREELNEKERLEADKEFNEAFFMLLSCFLVFAFVIYVLQNQHLPHCFGCM